MREQYLKYFETFAKMECALINTMYLRSNRGKAEANWDSFALNNDVAFFQNQGSELISACNYLANEPPMKLFVVGSQPRFELRNSNSNSRRFVFYTDALRTVRNNLFHGGKFNLTDAFNRDRNLQCVSNSQVILDAASKLELNVWQLFQRAEW